MKKGWFNIYDKNISELESKVVELKEDKGVYYVVLEKSPFRPSSGGQPSDEGLLKNENFEGFVLEVFGREGKLIHKVKVVKGDLSVGNKVHTEIDKERRRILTLMHSAEHIFSGALNKVLGEEKFQVEKISLNTEESSIFIRSEELNWSIIFKAERLANKIIREGRKVIIHYATKEDLQRFIDKGLRIKIERLKDDFVRIIEFENFDLSACSGTHVKDASEIKFLLITNLKNLGSGRFELKFKVGSSALEELFKESRVFRSLKHFLGKDDEKLFETVEKIEYDRKLFKEKYKDYLSKFVLSLKPTDIKNIEFYFSKFRNEEDKFLVKLASAICRESLKKSKKSVVVFFNAKNSELKLTAVASKNLGINLLEEFNKKIKPKYKVKGGGSPSLIIASFSAEKGDEEAIIKGVKGVLTEAINKKF